MRNQALDNDIGTTVGANVHLQGTLKDTNDITIHGSVEGEVTSNKSVTVTQTASIKGPVTADTIVIAGTVNGELTAKNKIEIAPSGKVFGSATTSVFIIQAGALFNGQCTMSHDKNDIKPVTNTSKPEGTTAKSSDFELE